MAQMMTNHCHNNISFWLTKQFLLRPRMLHVFVQAILLLILPHLSNAGTSMTESETDRACGQNVAKDMSPAVIITDALPPIEQYERGIQTTPPSSSYINKVVPALLEVSLLPCSLITIVPLSVVKERAKQFGLELDVATSQLTTLLSANILEPNKRYYLLRWSHTEQQGLIRLRMVLSRISDGGTIAQPEELASNLYTLTKPELPQAIDRITAQSARIISSQANSNYSRQPLKIAISCSIPSTAEPSQRTELMKLFFNQLMLRIRPKSSLTIQFIEPDIEGCFSTKPGQQSSLPSADGIIQVLFETKKDLLEIRASMDLPARGKTISIPLPIIRKAPTSDLSFLVMANLLGDHIWTLTVGAVDRDGAWKTSLLEDLYDRGPNWNEENLRRLFNAGIDLYQMKDETNLSASIFNFVFSKLNSENTAAPSQFSQAKHDRLELLSSIKLYLGRILITEKRFQVAIAELEEALIYNPNNSAASFELASTWGYLKNLGKARLYYRQTVAIQPTNQFARRRLAELALSFADYDEAESNFRKLLEVDPVPSVKNGLTDALVGQAVTAFESKCDRELALKKLEEALTLDPASDWLILDVAELSLLTNQPGKAKSILDSYLHGSSPELFRLRGKEREIAHFAAEYMSILSGAAMGEELLDELRELRVKSSGLEIPDREWDFTYLANYINTQAHLNQDFKSLAINIYSSVAVKGKSPRNSDKGQPCMTGSKR